MTNGKGGYAVWQDKYSVSVSAIDEQHKQVLDILNSMYEAASRPDNEETMRLGLKKLYIFTVTHFQYEETLLRILGYGDLDAHRKLHARMKENTEKYIDRYKSGMMDIVDLIRFLKDWWLGHIAGEDRKYIDHVKGLKL